MDKILYKLCRNNVSIMDGWHPYPSTLIANTLDISVGKVRYHLKKLKTQGLVESFYEGGMTEDGEVRNRNYKCPICGNSVTDYFNRKLKYCRECGQKIDYSGCKEY